MKIIEQSHEILKYDDPLKLIEAAGRTCYKSEDKITEDSAERFVKMIVKSGHLSVLEHASVCFMVSKGVSQYMQTSGFSEYLRFSEDMGRHLVSGNFRAWLEFFQNIDNEMTDGHIFAGAYRIAIYLGKKYPSVFPEIFPEISGEVNPFYEYEMSDKEKFTHATRTARVITDRGMQQEITRHRPWAYSIESTRYVTYDGDITFIKPVWCRNSLIGTWDEITLPDPNWSRAEISFQYAMIVAEIDYKDLLEYGWKAQQARNILPLSLSGEIIMTSTLGEWKHMLKQRCSKAAHPQMRALMGPLLAELKEKIPVVFDDIN